MGRRLGNSSRRSVCALEGYGFATELTCRRTDISWLAPLLGIHGKGSGRTDVDTDQSGRHWSTTRRYLDRRVGAVSRRLGVWLAKRVITFLWSGLHRILFPTEFLRSWWPFAQGAWLAGHTTDRQTGSLRLLRWSIALSSREDSVRPCFANARYSPRVAFRAWDARRQINYE